MRLNLPHGNVPQTKEAYKTNSNKEEGLFERALKN
ncbi:MAG: hypothetical protein JWR59_2520 [Brevundimonas sp.]|nr:hypothetical protein [Brevundimonas sp.]